MQEQSTRTVLDHHLAAFTKGLDELMLDYSDQSILVTPEATYRGLEQIRTYLDNFLDGVNQAFWEAMELKTVIVEGEIAYVVWAAAPFITLAADTLYVRDGVIAAQTFTSFTAHDTK